MNCIDNPQKLQPSGSGPEPAVGEAGFLPCLNSNIYIETIEDAVVDLTPYDRRKAFSLIENCQRFINEIGLDHVGFLTLTFPDNVIEHSEALKRWNSIRTNFMSKHFGRWMLVKERQKRGAIHYHILIEVFFDIRSGFNFDEVFPPKGKRPIYRSACAELRSLWQELRETLPKYGFGRSELAPIRSNDEGMAKYVGKYVSSNKEQTTGKFKDLDHGARMIAYSQNWPRSNTKFAWNSDGAKEWRRKVKRFAEEYVGVKTMIGLQLHLGPRWAYRFKEEIFNIDEILDNPGNDDERPQDQTTENNTSDRRGFRSDRPAPERKRGIGETSDRRSDHDDRHHERIPVPNPLCISPGEV